MEMVGDNVKVEIKVQMRKDISCNFAEFICKMLVAGSGHGGAAFKTVAA